MVVIVPGGHPRERKRSQIAGEQFLKLRGRPTMICSKLLDGAHHGLSPPRDMLQETVLNVELERKAAEESGVEHEQDDQEPEYGRRNFPLPENDEKAHGQPYKTEKDRSPNQVGHHQDSFRPLEGVIGHEQSEQKESEEAAAVNCTNLQCRRQMSSHDFLPTNHVERHSAEGAASERQLCVMVALRNRPQTPFRLNAGP